MLFNYDKTNGMTVGGTSIGSFFANQNKNILSEGNNQAFLDKMSNTETWNAPTTTSDWIASQAKNMKNVNEELVAYVQNAKEAGKSANTLESNWVSQTSAATKLSGVFSKLGDTAGKVIATVGNALVSMAATTIISLAVQGIQNLINSYDDLSERVGEITSEYTTARDTVDDYTSKLVNIRTKLEDESTTTEEAAQMTQQLYDIQNDLIGTYGSYAAGLDLVNGKLETQVGILQDINKQNLQKWENEANSVRSSASSGINVAANAVENILTGGLSGFLQSGKVLKNVQGGQGWIDAIKNSWTESDTLGNDLGRTVMGSSLKQIRDRMEEFNATIDATDSDKINEIISSFDAFSLNGDKINVSGSVNEVSDAVVQLQVELKNLGYANDNLDAQLSAIAKTTSDYINTSGDAYNNTLFTEIMRTDTLAEKYVTLTEAYHKFKEAQDSGDTEGVDTATKEFTGIWGTLTKDSNVTSDMLKYFKSLYPELQSAISDWELEVDVIPNIKDTDLEDYIAQNSYEQIFTDFLKWGDEEIEVPSSVENYFNTLQEYSEKTGIDILQLIKLLQQLDDFDMSKAEGKLKQAFSTGENKNPETLNEAIKQYQSAVSTYDKVNAGNFKLGEAQGKTKADDGKIIVFKTKFEDANGNVYEFSADEISSYVNDLISKATDETGKIDWSLVKAMDADEFVGGMTNMIDWETTNGNQVQLQAIENRAQAWTDLYNEANKANISVQDALDAFSKGTKWTEEQINDFLGSLDEDDLTTLLSMDLDEISKYQTEEELRQAIEEAQKIADENKIEIKPTASDLVSDLKDVEDAFSNLGTVKDAGTETSASDIEQVNSDMGGVTFGKFGDGTNISDVNAMSSAIEKYNKALTDNEATTEKINEATNDLVTSYIDLSGKLDNVTEATKDKTIEELESYGVENAEEVVITRMNKVYKNFSKNLQTLSKKVAQYHDTLENVDADNFTDAAKDIAETVKEMFTTSGVNGEDIIPEIDDSFIKDNLEDIKLAVEGDIEAIARLRVEAAKTIDMDINVNDDELYDAWSGVSNAIAQLDGTQFVVGGYMDDTQIIAALNEILATGRYTVEEFQAMVSQISGGTLSAEVTYEDKKISLPTPQFSTTQAYQTIASDGAITPSNSWKVTTTETTVRMPKMQYKYNGGTGSGAKYSGGGGSGSGGSGGGDGGSGSDSSNKKTEDDEETYDWIEVYIGRLEEELDRLDEVVESTYTSWSDRNKTLKKELENLNDQMNANTTAYDRYIAKANSIQVNDGNDKVNDDDYGDNDSEQKTYDQSQLTAAIKEWNSGKYQALIQSGSLGEKAIETIQNTYLKNTIEAYKEWYNKAIDAKDKATTLAETIKSKYEQMFNNIKSEYDELIDAISKKTDIVDERISRMEKYGYFVDSRYYEQQRKYTNEELEKQNKETQALIKKRNEAIQKGNIKVGSEADNQMLQDIQDSNLAAEQLLTKLVEIRNNQRQLQWDKFDWLEEQLERINKEAEHFSTMLEHFKQVDDLGNFTNEGLASLAAITTQYEQNQKKLEDYKKEYQKVQAELLKDPNNKDLIDRANELADTIMEAEEKSWEYAENAKSAWQEAFDAHLSNLQKVINEYKDALSAAKDLYTYQNNVEKQAKSIARLEKQIAAYGGDNSEAARKKRIELQQQYQEQQQQLQETEWDRYISETGELLDQMYEDYEEYLNKKLEDITKIMGMTNTLLNQNKQAVNDGFAKVTTTWDAKNLNIPAAYDDGTLKSTISTEVQKIIDAFKDIKFQVTNTDNNGNGATAKNNAKSKDVEDTNTDNVTTGKPANTSEEAKKQEQAKKEAEKQKKAEEKAEKKMRANKWLSGTYYDKNGDVLYTNGTWNNDGKGFWYSYTDKSGNRLYINKNGKGKKTVTIDGVEFKFLPTGYVEGKYENVKKKIASLPTANSKNKTGSATEAKKKTAKKKASGDRFIREAGIYETNEADTGSELIYKTSSGGILTPLDGGDMVFSHEMSQRLWDIANNDIPRGTGIQMVNIPSNAIAGTVNVSAEATFNLPNVKNYDEFKKGLQSDNSFEKFIQEITVGQLHGNNTMNKRKY